MSRNSAVRYAVGCVVAGMLFSAAGVAVLAATAGPRLAGIVGSGVLLLIGVVLVVAGLVGIDVT